MKKLLGLIGLSAVCLAVFQNCGSNIGMAASSTMSEAFSVANTDADYAWSLQSANGITVTRLGQVTRWLDATGKSLGLFPPVQTGSSVINVDRSPKVVTSQSGSVFRFGDQDQFTTETGSYLAFASSSYTVAFYLRNLTIPANSSVRFLDMIPADGSQAGEPVLLAVMKDAATVRFTAYEWFDGKDYSYTSVDVPLATVAAGAAVIVRFAKTPAQLSLSVNGGISATATVVGTLPTIGAVARTVTVHGRPDTGNDGGSGTFDLIELAFWLSELPDAEMSAFTAALSRTYLNGTTAIVPVSQ